VLPASYSKPKK